MLNTEIFASKCFSPPSNSSRLHDPAGTTDSLCLYYFFSFVLAHQTDNRDLKDLYFKEQEKRAKPLHFNTFCALPLPLSVLEAETGIPQSCRESYSFTKGRFRAVPLGVCSSRIPAQRSWGGGSPASPWKLTHTKILLRMGQL